MGEFKYNIPTDYPVLENYFKESVTKLESINEGIRHFLDSLSGDFEENELCEKIKSYSSQIESITKDIHNDIESIGMRINEKRIGVDENYKVVTEKLETGDLNG